MLRDAFSGALAPAAEAVTVSTIHNAKGLEWDRVYVVRAADCSPQPEEQKRRRLHTRFGRLRIPVACSSNALP